MLLTLLPGGNIEVNWSRSVANYPDQYSASSRAQ